MKEYFNIINDVIGRGTRKENRTGVDTISAFGHFYRINLQRGFPLLTSKYVNWKNIVIENLWFLSGDSSPDFLHRHGINFWNQWIEENGKLPEAYGEYWRDYPDYQECGEYPDDFEVNLGFDQFEELINRLKKNPNDRRLVLTNWNPPSAYRAKLPPCHLMAIFNVQNKYNRDLKDYEPVLSCHMTQRSCDTALGVPYNMAGYGFMTHLVAHLAGLKVGWFAHTLVDFHIYTAKPDGSMSEYDHMPGLKEQMKRTLYDLPWVNFGNAPKTLEALDDLIKNGTTEQIMDCFKIENYKHHPHIKFKPAI